MLAMAYDHQKIEKKWQNRWEAERAFEVTEDPSKPKWYTLVEFPYPSGAGLHVGHVRSYTALDIVSRLKRRQGMNVLYPIGWDAFGLPTENYAIKHKIHPREATKTNIANFTRQIKSLGLSFDWSREIDTTDPAYYKWTQWIFLQLYKKGLAYQADIPINWCPKCKIGLANEEVIDGKCERCGTETTRRQMKQWMLAITKYADRLIDDLKLVDYLPKISQQQINWIGRSEGVNVHCKIKGFDYTFDVYDSVPQTFMAQTFAVIAAEHPMLAEIVKGTPQEKAVMECAQNIQKKKVAREFGTDDSVEGMFTGRYIENPYGTGDLPLWVASFVVMDYGSGIVNCSAHDERDFAFAKKYGIPLRPVLLPPDPVEAEKVRNLEFCYHHAEGGILTAPEEFKGRQWGEVREDIITFLEKKGIASRAVNYKLRDWVFSRQHYWGEPIPLIHCPTCGVVPVPDDQLPVVLPDVEHYEPTDNGESPLAKMKIWRSVACPKCSGPAQRETDTMPNWAGSSWYFLRYTDSKNDQMFAAPDKLKYWMQVDLYNGGMEHTTLHLLYSRFWHKFLFDQGLVPHTEPYARRYSHGTVLANDGKKMSKSLGNVVNPDDVLAEFGADALRLYEMFMGPFEDMIAWDTKNVTGVQRFLDKAYKLREKVGDTRLSPSITRVLHRTLIKVQDDIVDMKFNTAVSAMMIALNQMEKESTIYREDWMLFLHILNPFAPHLTEELWELLGQTTLLSREPWPAANEEYVKQDSLTIVVQINGKMRTQLQLPVAAGKNEIEAAALANEKVQEYLAGLSPRKVIVVPGRLINIVI